MSILVRKVKSAVALLREGGLSAVLDLAESKYGIPDPRRIPKWFGSKVRYARERMRTAKSKWSTGTGLELQFWDTVFSERPDFFAPHFDLTPYLDPDLPLQPRPAALLPAQATVRILDVGAGPMTYLGMVCEGKTLDITAVDPLAADYDKILSKHGVRPLIKTETLTAEDLSTRFAPDSFDLVTAHNSIDHAFDPERAILQMIRVVRPGGYVLLEHRPSVGEREHYVGLHQWNFSTSEDGDFLISSRSKLRNVNMTKKYAKLCAITCETVNEVDGDWLVTRIQKKSAKARETS